MITVRPATPADLAHAFTRLSTVRDELCDLLLQDEKPPQHGMFGPESDETLFSGASDNSTCLVAEAANCIAGVLICRGGRYPENEHVARLGVFVADRWCQQGVGSELMSELISWARRNGKIKRLYVDLPANRETAISFFKKYGFQVETTKRAAMFSNDGFLDVISMALLLSSQEL